MHTGLDDKATTLSIIITFAAITRCYGLICTSVTDFCRRYLWIFAGRYESVTDPSDVTV